MALPPLHPVERRGEGEVSFSEKAQEYGLDNKGLSTHAAFFDYDNDGDLDCYLLTNSFRSVGNYDLIKDQRSIPDSLGGNKLYRNDDNHFKDVTSRCRYLQQYDRFWFRCYYFRY